MNRQEQDQINPEFKKFLEYQLKMHSLVVKTTEDPLRAKHFAERCFAIARQLGFGV